MTGAWLSGSWEMVRGYLWGVIPILACLAVLAFSSLSEAVLMRLEPSRVRHLLEANRKGARPLAALVHSRQEVLSSLVLVINLAVIVASAYATKLTIELSAGSTRWVPLSSAGMIVLILVVCEVAPKTYGVRRAERVGLAMAPMLQVAHGMARPLGRQLYGMSVWFSRRALVPLIGGNVTPQAPLFSDEEVMEIVSAGEAEGSIAEEEREMIHGVMEFADTVAREVMTPRTDMVCVPAESTLEEAAGVCQESGYSRLPVYEGTLDHVVGIVYALDMVAALQADPAGAARRRVGEIARKPAPVVPESKRLGELLPFMQRNRLHLAMVIDEYGGTAGLVTMEDLLEQIFGEIRDEYDVEAEPVQAVGEGVWVVDAKLSTDEVSEATGVELPEGDFDSLGGFILDQLGRLPAVGETVRWKGLEFTVEAVAENRVGRVRVTRRAEEGTDGEAEEGRG